MKNGPHDVFISYSSKDKAVADAVCAGLERDGVRCWIAPRDITIGQDWAASIIDAIGKAKVFVLLFSSFSNASFQVRREVERAAHHELPILPFRLEEITPNATLEFFLSTPHWLDAFNAPLDQHITKLSTAIQALLTNEAFNEPPRARAARPGVDFEATDGPAREAAASGAPQAIAPAAGAKARSWKTLAGLALAVVGALGAILWLANSHARPPATTSEAAANDGATATTGSAPYVLSHTMSDSSATVDSVAFSPDGNRIASGYSDGKIRLWDAATGEEIGSPFEGHTKLVTSIGFSPDGRRIVSGSNDKTVRIWDAATGQEIGAPIQGHTDMVSSVAFDPAGGRIMSASDDGSVRFWDEATGQEIGEPLKPGDGNATQAAYSADGGRLVTWSGDVIKVWDTVSGKAVGAPIAEKGVFFVALSPDGLRMATGSINGTIRIRDAATGDEIGAPMTSHTSYVGTLAYSPDGRRIVSGSFDQTIRVWDAATGQQIGAPLTGHTGAINSVAFDADSGRIASGAEDKTVRVWSAASR